MAGCETEVIQISENVAFEYLDDGGLLICELSRGDYWQMSSPMGQIWSWIWESRDRRGVLHDMTQHLGLAEAEAVELMDALSKELTARGILLGSVSG